MKIWGISNGSKGSDIQLEAISRALSQDVSYFHANLSFPWSAVAPYKIAELGVVGDKRFKPPFPDMVIACGRRAIPIARHVRRCAAGKCFTVYLQNPIINASWHKRLIPSIVNGKIVGILIGGPNKYYDFDKLEMQNLASNLLMLAQQGHRLIISLSSRSRDDYVNILSKTLADHDYYLWHGNGDNPYKAILGIADHLIVTGDSVNMIGEACFPGVPVQVYFLRGHSRRFNRFYEHLLAGNYVKPFEGKLESWDYEPRNATDDIVAKILDAYHEHQIK